MIGTTQELADLLKVDYQAMSGLLRYLREKGIVMQKGCKQKDNRGKPAAIFELPTRIELVFDPDNR